LHTAQKSIEHVVSSVVCFAYVHVGYTAGQVTKAILMKGGKTIAEECKQLGN